jgi:hypothetical protein
VRLLGCLAWLFVRFLFTVGVGYALHSFAYALHMWLCCLFGRGPAKKYGNKQQKQNKKNKNIYIYI